MTPELNAAEREAVTWAFNNPPMDDDQATRLGHALRDGAPDGFTHGGLLLAIARAQAYFDLRSATADARERAILEAAAEIRAHLPELLQIRAYHEGASRASVVSDMEAIVLALLRPASEKEAGDG